MRRWLSLVGVVAVLSLVYVASANLLVNPGFEIGPGGGGTPDGWFKYNEVGQEGWANQTGTNGMAFWNWNNGIYGGFFTDVSSNVNVGAVVNFSIWGNAEANYRSSDSETWLKIEWWTNGGSTWTMQSTLDVYGALTANPNTWNQYTLTVTNTLANVVTIKPLVGFGGGTNLALGSSAAKWDNADLTITDAIPEPTIAGLLGFAGLLFCAVRRRSSK